MTAEEKERAEWRRKHATIRIANFDDVKNEPDPPVPGTMEELMGLTWELTMMVCELGGQYDAKQPLQKHIAKIIRPSNT